VSKQQEIENLDKKILVARLVDMPGTVIFLLAIYDKFYAEGDAFIALLNNSKMGEGMFIFGAVLMVWGGYKIFQLKRQKSQLLKNTA
jgi:hypothetical protein